MALPSGGKQPSVRYIDQHVWYSGPSKTVVRRRERRGSTIYVYRTVYHHRSVVVSGEQATGGSKAGGGGGGGSKAGGGGGASHPDSKAGGRGPGEIARGRKLRQQIIARQRLLRAAGYGVVVDGNWGTRSQRAWRLYSQRRGSIVPRETQELRREANQLRQLNRRQATSRALAESQARVSRARLAAMQRSIQGKRDAEMQRAHPILYRHARDVQIGIVEREKQRAIEMRYAPDGRTLIAMRILRLSERLANPRTRTQVLRGMSASDLRMILFDPEFGVFDSLSTAHVRLVQGWLRARGHEVRGDGRLDETTLRRLGAEMRQLEREERREAIDHLVDTFYGGSGGERDLRVAGPINLHDLPGFGEDAPTPGELLSALQREDVVARRLLRELYRRLSVKQLAQIRAKYLKARVTQKWEWNASREILAQQLRDAEKDHWWGAVTGALDTVADATRASAVILWETIKDLDNPEEWFDAEEEAREHRRAIAQVQMFDYNHPYWGIATSILADPTNLIPGRVLIAPFVVGGRLTSSGVRALEQAGFKLSSTGRVVAIPSKLLIAPAATMRLPARARAAFWADDAADAHGIGGQLLRNAITITRNSTRLLSDTRAAAHLRTAEWLRRGFDADWLPPRVAAGGQKLARAAAPKLPRELAEAYDGAYRVATTNAHLPAEGLLDDFVKMRGSLYVNESGDLSDLGSILKANIAASIRSDAVRELARERGEAARRGLSVRDKRPDVLQAEYERVYDETIEQAGPYIVGYGDPELHAILKSRVNWRLKMVEEHWFPAFQNRIAMALDEAGESLFDETTGLWKGASGDFNKYLRYLGSEMFDEANLIELRNPLFGRFFKQGDMQEYAAAELRIRLAQKEGWLLRRRAAGEKIGDEWLEEQEKLIRRDLNEAWKRVDDGPEAGLFTDTRETLQVPLAYARQYLDLHQGGDLLRFFANRREATRYTRLTEGRKHYGRLSDLAASPVSRAEGADDVARGGVRVDADEADVLIPYGDPAALPETISSVQLDVDRVTSYFKGFRHVDDPADIDLITEADIDLRNFQESFSKYQEVRSLAYEATYGQALAREGALYSAMRYAQHRPIRFLWKMAEGALGLWRFFALPLRTGWAVVNHIDNSLKALLQGLTHPKYWFRAFEGQGGMIQSAFELGWDEIRHAVMFFDAIFGTRMIFTVDAVFDEVWKLPRALHHRIFKAQGFEFPDEMLDAATAAREGGQFIERWSDLAKHVDEAGEVIPPSVRQKALAHLASFHDRVWSMFGSRPENFAKRALYHSTYDKAVRDGVGHFDAHLLAWQKVDETLFDYSKISTIEDNLRWMFPFVQWARKNTQFWVKQSVRYPGLTLSLVDEYGNLREQLNEDLPEWMQRYSGLRWLSDAVERIPGLEWMVGPLADSATDPINLFSFKNLYRAFKSENPNLPADQEGNRFLDGMVTFLEDFGFSMNPLVRKPLEVFGMLDLRSWQSVFPQTTLAEAFTRKYFHERFPNGLNLERMLTDKVLELMGKEPTANHAAANFDSYVRMEMAGQAHRGEDISRFRAEEKIRDWLYVQAILGYFAGLYLRRMTPEDIYYSQLADAMRKHELDYLNLTPEERANYRLWKLRFDRVKFDKYVEDLPLVRAYYGIRSYVAAQKFLREHYDILPYVEERLGNRGDGMPGYVAQKLLQERTAVAINFFELVDKADLSPEVREAAETLLLTRELAAYWDLNRTPQEKRLRMLRGQYFRYINGLNQAYHAIPADDFDAKEGFLREHPDLVRSWAANNDPADDVEAIILATLADLRDLYFEYADAGDWDGANELLEAYPFIFDKFKDGKYVEDRQTGRPDAGSMSQHARDYLAAKAYLDYYFSLSESERREWLSSGARGAQVVKAYFDKYASRAQFAFGPSGGLSQHARDYLAAKPYLDRYFALPEAKRAQWLRSGTPAAKAVLAYFEKYAESADIEQKIRGSRFFRSRNAELARRLRFWREYWSLPPARRQDYVKRHAAAAGIFVYGLLSAREVHDRQQEWMRKAFTAGITGKAAHYLYVKPLLDFFFTLNREQKKLFLRATPELQDYFDRFSDKSVTGNPKLDKLLEGYFKLLPGSQERAQYLQRHPQVQDYFDSKSTPEERALHNLLEVYFELTHPVERRDFLLKHPEIQLYFDKRQREKSAEREVLGAFDLADPRLKPYRAGGASQRESVERMLDRLKPQMEVHGLAERREREPS